VAPQRISRVARVPRGIAGKVGALLSPMKYITATVNDVDCAFVFPDHIEHKDFWTAMRLHWAWTPQPSIIGAGFVTSGKPDGCSVSLNMGPGPDDEFLLNQLLK
jgi:hypothetical protein